MSSLPPEPSGTQIQSLQRGMRILELVSQSADGLALPELARRMDLGKTTVHNLARTLLLSGYLVQRRDPLRYVGGPALFALAGRQRLHALHERAAPVLSALSEEFDGLPALLVEAAGTEVRVVLRAIGGRPGGVERPLDRFSPPYANATSLLFIAFWNEEERRAFEVRYPFWEFAAHLWADEAELENRLKEVRTQGYAAVEQGQGRAFPVAFPIFSERGELLAAIGLAYRSAKKVSAAEKRRIIERVRAAAEDLRTAT